MSTVTQSWCFLGKQLMRVDGSNILWDEAGHPITLLKSHVRSLLSAGTMWRKQECCKVWSNACGVLETQLKYADLQGNVPYSPAKVRATEVWGAVAAVVHLAHW